MSTEVEKVALVGVRPPVGSIFRSACEVLDTEDPETKVFRFKDGVRWGSLYAQAKTQPTDITGLTLYSHWSEFDVGEKEGKYRITRVLDEVPGYIAVLEGTTKPLVVETPTVQSGDLERCERAILTALQSEARMTLRDLKQKTHAHRFKTAFENALKKLTDEGKLQLQEDARLFSKRTWVVLVPPTAA